MLFRKGSAIANLIEHCLAEVRFWPNAIMTFDNGEAIKAMIRIGFGIAMLPYRIVEVRPSVTSRRGEPRS